MTTQCSSKLKFRIVILAACVISTACSFNLLRGPQADLRRGHAYMAEHKFREASIEFQKALKRDPRCVEAFAGLARADLSLHRWRDARAAYQEALDLAPERSDLHLELGKLFLSGRLYSKGEAEAASVLGRDAHNVFAYELLGECRLGQQKYPEALETFQKLVELRPADTSPRVNLARVLIAMQRYADAEQTLRASVDRDPHFVEGYLNLANLYRLQKRPDQARQILEQASKANPDATALVVGLADLLYSERAATDADVLLRRLDERPNKSAGVSVALGDFYMQWKQPQRAVAEYQRGLQAAPHDLRTKDRLVDAYLSSGNLREGSALNQDVLRQAPDDLDAQIGRGRVLLAEGKTDDAILELRQTVAAASDSYQAHYYLGMAYWKKNRLDQAKTEMEQALEISPDSPAILQSLAEVNLAAGDGRVAAEYAKRAVAQSTAGADEHVLLGNIYLNEHKRAEAEEEFVTACGIAPDSVAAHMGLAEAGTEAQNPGKAESEYEVALRLQPQNSEALGRLVDAWVGEHRPEHAIARVREYLSTYPNDSWAHLVMGSLLQGQNPGLARAEFERAIQLDPRSVQGHLRLGKLFQEQGQINDALGQFEQSLSLRPDFAPLCTMIGNLHLDQGDLQSAERYYQRALAADPNFGVAAGNLAWVYANRGTNLNVALSLAQKAKQLLPDLDSISDTLALVYYKKGLYSSALPLFQECVRKAPLDPSYRYHLGLALIAAGDGDGARSELQTALKLKLPADQAEVARRTLGSLQ